MGERGALPPTVLAWMPYRSDHSVTDGWGSSHASGR